LATETFTIKERPAQKVTVKPCNTVIVWYHNSDYELIKVLDPHIRLLRLRFPQFRLHYFGYPTRMPSPPSPDEYPSDKKAREEYISKYEAVIADFERCMLFIPCVSNEYLLQLGDDAQRDARLGKIFEHPTFETMPVRVRPTNVGEENPSVPLSAYTGYQLDQACQAISVQMEHRLRNTPHFQSASSPSPLIPLLFAQSRKPEVVEQKKPWWSHLI
jgi:hypothetical protein